MKVGIIAVQGAVSEHIEAVRKALSEADVKGEVVPVRKRRQLEELDGLIIPGGESTTISRLLDNAHMIKKIREMAKSRIPIMGTCTGCILMAKEGDEEVKKTKTELLRIMDMKVIRNAYGRQRESFETLLKIGGFDTPYKAIFIRAPAIVRVRPPCQVLASFGDKIVMARQENLLAVAFHPELTNDLRIHKILLNMILSRDF